MTTPETRQTRRYRAGWLAAGQASPGAPAARVVPLAGGRRLNAGGMDALEMIAADSLLMVSEVIRPWRMVRAHYHAAADQWSLVTRGTLMFQVGGQTYVVEEGGLIVRPRGLVHAVWNPGPGLACQVEGNMPGDAMLQYYEQYAELANPGPPDPAQAAALAARHGVFFDDGLTLHLERTYGVSADPAQAAALAARHGVFFDESLTVAGLLKQAGLLNLTGGRGDPAGGGAGR